MTERSAPRKCSSRPDVEAGGGQAGGDDDGGKQSGPAGVEVIASVRRRFCSARRRPPRRPGRALASARRRRLRIWLIQPSGAPTGVGRAVRGQDAPVRADRPSRARRRSSSRVTTSRSRGWMPFERRWPTSGRAGPPCSALLDGARGRTLQMDSQALRDEGRR
ncbi:MAG: hypothetical protein MZW92_56885 [Comamonadaceae bacterium]|nr:hypothetical protein [Comamonadaceae bacterium]